MQQLSGAPAGLSVKGSSSGWLLCSQGLPAGFPRASSWYSKVASGVVASSSSWGGSEEPWPGQECSQLWGACQVGGGGNSNQIRHTLLDPAESAMAKAGAKGNRKDSKRRHFR